MPDSPFAYQPLFAGAAVTTWCQAGRAAVYVLDQSSRMWALIYDGTGWSWSDQSA